MRHPSTVQNRLVVGPHVNDAQAIRVAFLVMFPHSASETRPCRQNHSMSALLRLSLLYISLLAAHASHDSQGAENTEPCSRHPRAAEYNERVVRETTTAIYQKAAVNDAPSLLSRSFIRPQCWAEHGKRLAAFSLYVQSAEARQPGSRLRRSSLRTRLGRDGGSLRR